MDISRDDAELLANDQRWRDAMQRMGRVVVEAELSRRPGRPGERIDDIVYEPPYPTREFCRQWCAEQDNVLFRFSPTTGVILVLIVIVTGCLVQVFGGTRVAPHAAMRAAAPAAGSRGAVYSQPTAASPSRGSVAPPSASQSSSAAQWPGLSVPAPGTPGTPTSGPGTSR